MDPLTLAITALGSAAAAALATALGFYTSGLQRRREKAFEGRSKWYEDIIDVLHAKATLFEARAMSIEAGRALGIDDDERFFETLKKKLWDLERAVWTSRLYATKRSILSLNTLLFVFKDLLEAGLNREVRDTAAASRQLGLVLRVAADRLANEYRGELGLEQLAGDWKQFDKFVDQVCRENSELLGRRAVVQAAESESGANDLN